MGQDLQLVDCSRDRTVGGPCICFWLWLSAVERTYGSALDIHSQLDMGLGIQCVPTICAPLKLFLVVSLIGVGGNCLTLLPFIRVSYLVATNVHERVNFK